MNDLNDYFDSLRREGRYDSSSRFTVDLAKIQQKLTAFQFADPGFYVLKVVQAAVAGGSNHVQVRVGSDVVTVSWTPTRALEELQALPRLLATSMEEAGGTVFHHLVVALRAGLGLNPEGIVLQMRGPEGFRACFSGTGLAVYPAEAGRGEFLCEFAIRRPRQGSVLKELSRRVGLMVAESVAISDRCRFAPVPIFLDGRAINNPNPEKALGMPPHPAFTGVKALDLAVRIERFVVAPSGAPLEELVAAALPWERRASELDVATAQVYSASVSVSPEPIWRIRRYTPTMPL